MVLKLMGLNPDIEERMQDRIDKSGDCWLWTGTIYDSGYGIIINYGKRERVHRVAYVLAYGDIPDGMLVDHKCRVRNCVNPRHLRLATNKQNMENREGLATSAVPYRGVSRVFRKKAQAYHYIGKVYHHGEYHYCGTHSTAELANASVVAKRNELFTHNESDQQ